MSRDWNLVVDEPKVVTRWKRSRDQRIWCPLDKGRLPELTADIQEVRVYDDGHVEEIPLGSIVVKISDMTPGSPDFIDACEIQRRLTRILGRRIDPSSVVEDEVKP